MKVSFPLFMSTKSNGSVVFSQKEFEMFDHYLAELEALKDRVSGEYIESDDTNELIAFLDQ